MYDADHLSQCRGMYSIVVIWSLHQELRNAVREVILLSIFLGVTGTCSTCDIGWSQCALRQDHRAINPLAASEARCE